MNFFTRMSELIEGYTVQITIKKEGDQLIVLMVPKLDVKKDEVQNEIVPLSLKGSAEQLDDAFWATVSEGLRQITELQSNLSAYQDGIDKAAKKAKSDTKSKSKPDTRDEKKAGLFDKDKKQDTVKAEKKEKSKKEADKKAEEVIPGVDKSTGEIKKEPKVETPVAATVDSETKTDEPVKDTKTDEKVTDQTEKSESSDTTPRSTENSDNTVGNDEFKDDEW